MEESSEKRRERLRAMREEASLVNNEEGRGSTFTATPPEPAGLPPPNDVQQPIPYSPSPRFEFYTDPLAAFSGSQRKKKPKSSLDSPFGGVSGSPAPTPCKSLPSPFLQPDLRPPGNFNSPGRRNLNASLPPPGSYSTPGPYPNPNPNPSSNPDSSHLGMGRFFPAPNSNPNHSNFTSSMFVPSSTSPGRFSTPGSAEFNPKVTPQGGISNPGPSMESLSASQIYNGGGSGGPFMITPVPFQYNQGRCGFSSDSSPQHRAGSVNNLRNTGMSQSGMSSSWSQGSNHSRGSFMQSPGSNGRDNRTPGRSGGSGFQRNQNDASAATNPEAFAKRSMLLDPWKDLVPVRMESVAARLNSCSVSGSQDWLPKSVNKGTEPLNSKGVTVSPLGPSLAESLAASFADAVAGEGFT